MNVLTRDLTKKQHEQLATNRTRVEQVLNEKYWLPITEKDLTWKHKELPLIVQAKIDLPIRGCGESQIYQTAVNQDETGNRVYEYLVRKISPKGYYYSDNGFDKTIRQLVQDFRKEQGEKQYQQELELFKQLGGDKYIHHQAQTYLTYDLLRKVYPELVAWSQNNPRESDQKEKLTELLYTHQPNWKTTYQDDQLFSKEKDLIFGSYVSDGGYWMLEYRGLMGWINDFQETLKTEHLNQVFTEFKSHNWEHYLNLTRGVSEGQITRSECEVQVVTELKKLLMEISDRRLEYRAEELIKECLIENRKRLTKLRKNWTAEQWKSYVPRDKNGQLETYGVGLKDWDASKTEWYFKYDLNLTPEAAKEQVRELSQTILNGIGFSYLCKWCKEAGESLFYQVYRSKHTLIYACSRCENTECSVSIRQLTKQISAYENQ